MLRNESNNNLHINRIYTILERLFLDCVNICMCVQIYTTNIWRNENLYKSIVNSLEGREFSAYFVYKFFLFSFFFVYIFSGLFFILSCIQFFSVYFVWFFMFNFFLWNFFPVYFVLFCIQFLFRRIFCTFCIKKIFKLILDVQK